MEASIIPGSISHGIFVSIFRNTCGSGTAKFDVSGSGVYIPLVLYQCTWIQKTISMRSHEETCIQPSGISWSPASNTLLNLFWDSWTLHVPSIRGMQGFLQGFFHWWCCWVESWIQTKRSLYWELLQVLQPFHASPQYNFDHMHYGKREYALISYISLTHFCFWGVVVGSIVCLFLGIASL